ncbi:MAG: hypothetical protein WAQ08_21650 [Aquabacterium sp.]|uniref:hypothetical protein n=1 Tax=Aquabacterium sp. TaxID=1872578 RepID=UPI003BAE88FB
MSQHQSLADQAVETLAAVSAMTDALTNDHPERHAVRSLKPIAQDIISNALRQARDLAYQAEEMQREQRRVEASLADTTGRFL